MGTLGKSLLILISWNVLVRLVAVLAYFLLPSRFAPLDFIAPFFQSNFLFWAFANFDGEHYLSIAQYGYQFRGGFPQFAFFPLLPTAISALAYLTRDLYLSGMLVSQLSLWVALVYLHKWTKIMGITDLRFLLLFAPGAIFLSAIYTEPVFLALATMTMYFSERKWWGRAVLATALATATRINGVFLVLFLVSKLYRSGFSWVKSGLYGLASLSGLLGFMLYLKYHTGDPFAWFNAQSAWGKSEATSPLLTAISYLRAVTVEFSFDLVHLVVVLEVAITLLAIYLFIRAVKHKLLDYSYLLYLAGNLAMPIMTGSLGSMPRFYLILFPLLSVIPTLPKPGKTVYYIFSIITFITGTILFMRGYWYA